MSVVIANFRTPDLAARCAASIDAPVAEVLVVDNASRDGSVAALEACGLSVLERTDNDGFAALVNDGVRSTSGDVVLCLNADTELRPGAVAALVEHLQEHDDVAVAAPVLEAPGGRELPTAYRRNPGPGIAFFELCVPLGYLAERWSSFDPYRMRPRDWTAGRAVAHVQGAAMAVRRAAWEQSNGLDERYFLYLEETEWQERLRSLGWRIAVVPAARAVHLRRSGQGGAAPSIHYLHSLELYLADRHVPRVVTRVLIATSVTISRLFLRMLGLLPRRGAAARVALRDWAELWNQWRSPTTRPVSSAGAPSR